MCRLEVYRQTFFLLLKGLITGRCLISQASTVQAERLTQTDLEPSKLLSRPAGRARVSPQGSANLLDRHYDAQGA